MELGATALNIIFILAGFMLLIKGADYLVEGSSSIARRLGVSTLVIGLTVVAFGTSAPELVVNILSATSGRTELAFGNINGSNIANILLILGAAALFARIPVKSQTVIKEIPFMLLSGFVLLVITADVWLEGAAVNQISRIDGIVLLSFFVIFMYYLWLSTRETKAGAKVEKEKKSFGVAAALTVMGLAGLVIGGYLAVEGASGIARMLGASETLIGLTIVALGTSLPELVAAVTAARKGETDLAIGNVVGSNVFNILLVLGITSTITPVPVSAAAQMDAVVAFLAMTILFFAIFNIERDKQGRRESPDIEKPGAIFFLLMYVAYIVYIVIRG